MWKLHRYYLREVTTNSLLTFLVLFGIVLVAFVYRGVSRTQGFPLLAAAKTTLFFAADTIPHLLSMSLLFGTVLTFARSSQEREITAIRAAGVSPLSAMSPALLVGIVFAIVGAWALHWVIPKAHFHKYRVVADELRQVILNTGLTDDRITFNDLVMTWDDETEDGGWENVHVFMPRPKDTRDFGALARGGVFVADRARLFTDANRERLGLAFESLRHPASGSFLGAPSISFDIRRFSEKGRRTENEKDLTSDQLIAEVDRRVHPRPGVANHQVQRRSCFAIMPMLLAPLGFCIGVLSRDRGRVAAMVFGMLPLFVFYAGDFLANKLVASSGSAWFAWTPAALVVLGGIPLLTKVVRS